MWSVLVRIKMCFNMSARWPREAPRERLTWDNGSMAAGEWTAAGAGLTGLSSFAFGVVLRLSFVGVFLAKVGKLLPIPRLASTVHVCATRATIKGSRRSSVQR